MIQVVVSMVVFMTMTLGIRARSKASAQQTCGSRQKRTHRAAREQRSVAGSGDQKRGAIGAATGGERRGARQAPGRRASGPAGGRAGDTTERGGARTESGSQAGTPTAPTSGPTVDGPAPNLPSVPSVPQTDAAPELPSVEVELPLPEAPQVTVPEETPRVELPGGLAVPAVPLPDTGPVTDALPVLP